MDPGAIACVVWLVHNPQGQACMCAQLTHWCVHCRVQTRGVCASPVAPMRACAGWARLLVGTARRPHPSAESARGRVGMGRPGNLSQLLCSVSGKPPAAGVLPAEPTCLCTCPLGFQESSGEALPPALHA